VTATLTGDRLTIPAGLLRRARELHLDDVVEVRGVEVSGRGGERVTVDAALAGQVRRAVEGPGLGGGFAENAEELRVFTGLPHGPRRLAQALVAMAEKAGATDVHLSFDGVAGRVRFRLEGELVDVVSLPRGGGGRLVAALKGWSGCLPYRHDLVQEGRIGRTGIAADVRTSFVPTPFGDRVALRLFGRLRTLPELGLGADVLAALQKELARRSGLLLVSGSTGAGKTTTLYALLSHLAASRTGAHLSLEDPVEQRLRAAGVPVDQVELDPARGRTGTAMLAAALRQDVDVVSVGELRTPDEVTLALQAAQTGRLVLAGLHAGSVDEARRRLLDLGADETVLASTLRAVLHQSLVVVPDPSSPLGRRRRLDASLRTFGDGRGLEVVA